MIYITTSLLLLLGIFWFIRTTKALLFWLHLWQLKEYHVGRFADHFQTEKGKKLVFNKVLGAKMIFLLGFLLLPMIVIPALFVVYFFEAAKGILDFFLNRIKKPVLTQKTILLIGTGIVAELFSLWLPISFANGLTTFSLKLLIFDIFTPLIVTAIVFLFHPLAIISRNQTVKKAGRKRDQFKDLIVIGITGSYGKTSTKEFLYDILVDKFGKDAVLKTKEHQNSEIGIARCILSDLKPEHKIFIVEMGAYTKGGIKYLCSMAKPKIGILTGINEQHMSTFGSQENIVKAKYELIESLPENGVAFFNAKNNYCLNLYEKAKIRKYLYGQEATLPGTENILGAMAVAKELGMTEEEVVKASEKIENKFGGIQLRKGTGGLNIIDATYSANPDGVLANLDYLNTFVGKKIIIMPCLIELGSASVEVHRRIGMKISEVCDLAIITTKERFDDIKERAGNKVIFMEVPEDIFSKIKETTKEGDTVLLESRVPQKLLRLLNVCK